MAAEEKGILHEHLRGSRAAMLDKLDGIGEYDRRRPLVPTGTNLLGLVKHLAGLEYGYLGSCFGREPGEPMPWTEDEIWGGADMWATADETSEYLIGFYRRACAHADSTIEELDLDTIGEVPWWPEERRKATLRRLLVRMVGETARHAGHADIVRELIDEGPAGRDGLSDDQWRHHVAKVQAAADTFR